MGRDDVIRFAFLLIYYIIYKMDNSLLILIIGRNRFAFPFLINLLYHLQYKMDNFLLILRGRNRFAF